MTSPSPAACPSITDAQWERIKNALASPSRLQKVAREVIKEWGDFKSGVGYNGNYLVCLHAVSIALVRRAAEEQDPAIKDRVWLLLGSTALEHMHQQKESLRWVRQLPAFMKSGELDLSWSELTDRLLSKSAHTDMPHELGQTLVSLLAPGLPDNWSELLVPLQSSLLTSRQSDRQTIEAWNSATHMLLLHLVQTDSTTHLNAARHLIETISEQFNSQRIPSAALLRRWENQVTSLLSTFLNTPQTPIRQEIRDEWVDSVVASLRHPQEPPAAIWVKLLMADETGASIDDQVHTGHGLMPRLAKDWLSTHPQPSEILRALEKTAPNRPFRSSEQSLQKCRLQLWSALDEDILIDQLAIAMVARKNNLTEEIAALLSPEAVASVYESFLAEELEALPTVKAAVNNTMISRSLSSAHAVKPASKSRM